MRRLVILVPGRLDTPTGGYVYDRHIADGLARQGWAVEVRELDDSFPHPTPAALAHAAGVLDALPNGTVTLVDGLALGAMPDAIEQAATRLRIVALVHLPLGQDISRDRDSAARLAASERRALAAAALIVVTGQATRALLAAQGVSRNDIVVVEPGTARAPVARGSGGAPLQLLSVGTLNPIKGHEILLAALADVPDRDWHLTCAGSLTRCPETVARVRAVIQRFELDERVTLPGELDAGTLGEHYDRADLFVLATRQETYGMAVAEALARGLPVVSTTTGAIPDLVGTDAGLLVPPDDIDALTVALTQAIGNPALRARLAAGARAARGRLRDWDQACGEMAVALERVDGE